MSGLLELAERLEAATGPDREIDTAIFAAVRTGADWMHSSPEAQRVWAQKYTESLDAAMTLVPDNWRYSLSQHISPLPHVRAQLQSWHDIETGKAASGALALCAASLRALASLQARGDQE